ncbi:MAG: hypothetical protein FJ290_05545 [Planctomycetes bacterium]|nr:hypothetical protein [Planctomycetota bacterium]
MPKAERNETLPKPADSVSGCLVRLAWMLFGNVALFVAGTFIARHTTGFLSLADAGFWAVVALMIGVRRVDIARFKGQTVMGEAATMSHWRRYVAVLLLVALVGWGLAHGIARLSA